MSRLLNDKKSFGVCTSNNEMSSITKRELIAEEEVAILEDEKQQEQRKNKKLKRKVLFKNVLIVILIIIIILLLLKSCSSDGGSKLKPLVDFENGVYVEPNEVPNVEHVEGTTAIPVISDFTVSKSFPYVTLFNPDVNLGYSYLKYKFTNKDTGDVIYESKLVQPGKKFSVAFGDMLEIGTYNVSVEIYSYDYDDPTIQKNGGHSDIKVVITK